MNLLKQLLNYAILLRLNKPIGIYLLLWPTLIALWIAGAGQPNLKLVVIFVMGVAIMRSAGCVMNDIADRAFDGSVRRTQNRPLVTQQVSVKEAKILIIILLSIALLLVLQLNYFSILIACLSLALAIIYPFMKRVTHLPQLILGLAFSSAIPMAFAAQCNTLPPITWWLMLANVCWVVAYDTQYAMADRAEDLKIGLKSTAILFGNADRWIILVLQGLTLFLFLGIGFRLKLNTYYYLGIFGASLQVIYQFFLLQRRDPAQCFKAFLNNHFLGAWIFSGLFLAYVKG